MKQTLEERIVALHAELQTAIAAYIDMRAAMVPGVPRGNIEAIILARAGGCRCAEYRLVQKLIADEEKLTRQQADAQFSTG